MAIYVRAFSVEEEAFLQALVQRRKELAARVQRAKVLWLSFPGEDGSRYPG